MRLSVPSSSSSPHRPQLRTSSATRRKSLRLATSHPLPVQYVAELPVGLRAAVHPEHLAVDVARRLAVEKDEHTGLLLGLCGAAQRVLERVEEFLPVGASQLIEDWRVGDAWGSAVDPD